MSAEFEATEATQQQASQLSMTLATHPKSDPFDAWAHMPPLSDDAN